MGRVWEDRPRLRKRRPGVFTAGLSHVSGAASLRGSRGLEARKPC